MSTFPDRYREVSVTDVDVPLELAPLRDLLTSRPVYRRTRYMLVRRAGRAALVEVHQVVGQQNAGDQGAGHLGGEHATSRSPLFCDIDDITLLAGPHETVWLHRPELDPGIPSDLIRAAAEVPDARCVVLEGRYGHISFVLDPTPVRLHVLDVAPPWPAKLLDQVERVLATAEDLPGVLPVPHVVALPDLLPQAPAAHYLLPCRGGTMEVPGAQVSYLDEVPPRQDWTLLGCARSRAIHDVLYGQDTGDGALAQPVAQVDTCPRSLAAAVEVARGEVLLTKCCLLEEHVEVDGHTVVVPWGASFGHLREALDTAVELAGP